MKNICFISRDNSYGAGVFTLKMIHFYLDQGIKVTLFGTSQPNIQNLNFSFSKIKLPRGSFILKEPIFFIISFFLFFVHKKKFDKFIFPFRHGAISIFYFHKIITIFHSTHNWALKGHLRAINYIRAMSVKTFFYHMIWIIFNFLFTIFDLYNVLFSYKSIFISEDAMFLKKIFQKRYLLLENYCDAEKNKKINSLSNKSNPLIFCYIGRLDPLKWIDLLCYEINKNKKIINKKIWLFELLIVGDGILSEELKKFDFVKLIWKVPYDEIEKFYIQTDLLLLPSLYENQPIVLLDAIKFWTPFLSTPYNSFYNKIIKEESVHFAELHDFVSRVVKIPHIYNFSDDKYFIESKKKFTDKCLKIIYE